MSDTAALVASPHFRWMPGMLTLAGGRCVEGEGKSKFARFVDLLGGTAPYSLREGFGKPDLADPATIGCLLALVREAWAGWVIAIGISETGASLRVSRTGSWRFDGTLGEALTAALLAAPPKEKT